MIFPQDRYCIVDNKPCASEQLYCSNNCKLQDTKDQSKANFNTRKPLKTRLITSSTIIKRSNNSGGDISPTAALRDNKRSDLPALNEDEESIMSSNSSIFGDELDDAFNFKTNEHDILEDSVFSIENVDNTHTYPLPVQARSSISSGGFTKRRSTHGNSIISTLLMPPSLVSDKGFDTEDDDFETEDVDDDELLVQWNYEYITDDEESNNNSHWLYETPYAKQHNQDQDQKTFKKDGKFSFTYDLSTSYKSPTTSSSALPFPAPISFKTIQDIMSSSDSSLDLKPQPSSRPTAVASNYELWLNKVVA